MKKVFLLFCGFLFWVSITSAFAKIDPPYLKWEGTAQLSAADFRKATPDRQVKVKTGKNAYRKLEGFINCGIQFSYEATGKRVEYTVYSYMDPEESWMEDKGNDATLKHEQAHFNITEVYARLLRKQLKRIHHTATAQKVYKKMFRELRETQKKFDKDNSGESGVTPAWENWIEKKLTELKIYAAPLVIPD